MVFQPFNESLTWNQEQHSCVRLSVKAVTHLLEKSRGKLFSAENYFRIIQTLLTNRRFHYSASLYISMCYIPTDMPAEDRKPSCQCPRDLSKRLPSSNLGAGLPGQNCPAWIPPLIFSSIKVSFLRWKKTGERIEFLNL